MIVDNKKIYNTPEEKLQSIIKYDSFPYDNIIYDDGGDVPNRFFNFSNVTEKILSSITICDVFGKKIRFYSFNNSDNSDNNENFYLKEENSFSPVLHWVLPKDEKFDMMIKIKHVETSEFVFKVKYEFMGHEYETLNTFHKYEPSSSIDLYLEGRVGNKNFYSFIKILIGNMIYYVPYQVTVT